MHGKGWTKEERRVLINMYPHHLSQEIADRLGRSVKSVYSQANLMSLEKSEAFKRSINSGRILKMRLKGEACRFQKGNIPMNAGKKWQEFRTPEGQEKCLKTAFKKGNAPHNTKQDGDVVIRGDKSGKKYKYIRVRKSVWIELHRALWIMINGPIPKGKVLRCKTEDTLNCDPSNWEIVDRSMHLAKNMGRDEMNDKYIALVLSRRDKEVREVLLSMPEILDLKRTELNLKQTINEQQYAN